MELYLVHWLNAKLYEKTHVTGSILASAGRFWATREEVSALSWWKDVWQDQLAAFRPLIFVVLWNNSWERGNALLWRSWEQGLEASWHQKVVEASTFPVEWLPKTKYQPWRSTPCFRISMGSYSRESLQRSLSSVWCVEDAWQSQSLPASLLPELSKRCSGLWDPYEWSCGHVHVWEPDTSA